MTARHTITRTLLSTLLLAACSAQANQQFNLQAGADWRSTPFDVVGQRWMAGNFTMGDGTSATPNYGNSVTNLPASAMMWACGAGGALCPDGSDPGTGPSGAYFGMSFYLKPEDTHSGQIRLIADDLYELAINGSIVSTALLDQHMDLSHNPLPLTIDLTPFLTGGTNVVAIHAMDGYLEDLAACAARTAPAASHATSLGNFCQTDRSNEYVYIIGSVTSIPEPDSGWLSAVAMLGLALAGRRTVRTRR